MKRRGGPLADDVIEVDGYRVPRMILFGLHDPRWDPDPSEDFNVMFDRYVSTVSAWCRSVGLVVGDGSTDWDAVRTLRRRGLPLAVPAFDPVGVEQ